MEIHTIKKFKRNLQCKYYKNYITKINKFFIKSYRSYRNQRKIKKSLYKYYNKINYKLYIKFCINIILLKSLYIIL